MSVSGLVSHGEWIRRALRWVWSLGSSGSFSGKSGQKNLRGPAVRTPRLPSQLEEENCGGEHGEEARPVCGGETVEISCPVENEGEWLVKHKR